MAAAFASLRTSRAGTRRSPSTNSGTRVRDEHSTNGTWVNGDRVLPRVDVRLADGDNLRLAADVTAQVSLPTE